MLVDIQAKLMERGLVSDTWAAEMEQRGQLVRLFRDYYDGIHRAELTNEMRKMLRVKNNRLDRFNVNYCPLVVDAMADRLTVDTVEPRLPEKKKAEKKSSPLVPLPVGEGNETSPTDPQADSKNAVPTPEGMMGENGTYQASKPKEPSAIEQWTTYTLECNRFDALQIDVREAALRDGDTFVMVEYSDKDKEAKFAHELVWDGVEGCMVVYDRMGKSIVAGVKVWQETTEKRVNIYYPGETLKYKVPISTSGGVSTSTGSTSTAPGAGTSGLEEFSPPEPTVRNGVVPGVPIVHFKNKGTKVRGSSELINVIPLQDALNRTLVSMVMTAELSAFQIRTAKGFAPPADLAPGMWVQFGVDEDDASVLGAMEAGVMEQAQLAPFISEGDWIIYQIGTTTYTPLPASSDTQSGEALKQREIALLSKVRRAMVQFGNSWENVLAMAHSFTQIFGGQKLEKVERWNTRWKDPQIRNDTDLVAIAEWFMKHGFEREALRVMSQGSFVNYSAADIDEMIEQKARDGAMKMRMFQLPGMGRFSGVKDDAPPPQRNGNNNAGQSPQQPQVNNRRDPMMAEA